MTKIKFHIHVVSIYLEKSREKGSYLIVHFRMTNYYRIFQFLHY